MCPQKTQGINATKRISIHFHTLCQINAVFFVRNASNLNVKLAWREIVEQPEMSLLPSEPSAHINNPNQTVMRHFGADPCASFIKDRMKKKTSRSSITVEFVTIKRQTHINSQLQNKPKAQHKSRSDFVKPIINFDERTRETHSNKLLPIPQNELPDNQR